MLKKYFTKALLYNILIAVAIIIALLFIVQRGLRTYTRHGQSIIVPDLQGLSLAKVKDTLERKNLDWQVMDSVYDMSKPPLSVVDQNPKANSKVKQGRTIYVTINATTVPTVEIPHLAGNYSLKSAKMQLESYGLKAGDTIYKDDPFKNAVIGMQINGRNVAAKTRVPKGTVIDLVVGNGLGNGRISVPYLIGLPYEEADFKLKGNSLSVGALVVDAGVTDTVGAVVYKQIPAYRPGKTIRMGEPIDLFLAKELPEGIKVDSSLYDIQDTVK